MGTALAIAVCGCAQVRPHADFAQARGMATEATGVKAIYDPDVALPTDEELNAILADGLTLDEATRFALLNNRRLHAGFMSIGVARADWVQAGLLSNPTLGFSAQFPEGGGRSNIQASIAQNIMELWQIPRRKKVAQAALDESILRIAHVAASLAADTKVAYFRARGAEELVALARRNVELLNKTYQTVKAQREAGTASMLDENMARGQVLVAELGARNARLAAANAKRRLAQLLSVARTVDDITLVDDLVDTFDYSPCPEALIELASCNRLDLRALERSVRARQAAVGVERLNVVPDISLGLAFERGERPRSSGEPGGEEEDEIDTILGPTLGLTLPIFDQNQAQIAKAEYLCRQAMSAYEDAYIRIAQEIRIVADNARTGFQNAAYYRDELVPQAQRNLEFATVSYMAGQTNILILIEAQRNSLDVQRGYIEARLEASTAMCDLARTVGLPIQRVMDASDRNAAPG